MKTSKVRKLTALATALLAWLLVQQTAQAFYNPSTGRWLNRDIQLEAGGDNLYAAFSNDAPDRTDRLGLKDFEWRYPKYDKPHEGPSGVIYGATRWIVFNPRVHLWQRPGSPCCWGLMFDGDYAQLEVWWVKGDEETKTHELYHVNNHYYPAYAGFKSEAESYMSPCKTHASAACYANVIEGALKEAYMSWSGFAAAIWDMQQYGSQDPTGETSRRVAQAAVEFFAWRLAADLSLLQCAALNTQ
jgi:hypothetical protein